MEKPYKNFSDLIAANLRTRWVNARDKESRSSAITNLYTALPHVPVDSFTASIKRRKKL